jgi:hypothetical protein
MLGEYLSEQLTGGWSKTRDEGCHNLYYNNIRVSEYRKIKWTERVVRMGEMRILNKIFVEELERQLTLPYGRII